MTVPEQAPKIFDPGLSRDEALARVSERVNPKRLIHFDALGLQFIDWLVTKYPNVDLFLSVRRPAALSLEELKQEDEGRVGNILQECGRGRMVCLRGQHGKSHLLQLCASAYEHRLMIAFTGSQAPIWCRADDVHALLVARLIHSFLTSDLALDAAFQDIHGQFMHAPLSVDWFVRFYVAWVGERDGLAAQEPVMLCVAVDDVDKASHYSPRAPSLIVQQREKTHLQVIMTALPSDIFALASSESLSVIDLD